MVKLQIVSDLHIETGDGVPDALTLIKPSADILILAGDIGRINRYDQLKAFLTDVCRHFQAVLYVLGNHEYYRLDQNSTKTMSDLYQDVMQIQDQIPNLYILQQKSVTIGDVCIIGCTLWTRALCAIPPFIVRVNGMTTSLYNELFYRDLNYIQSMIKYCQLHRLKLVVITHHCPTFDVLKRKADRYRSLYASSLDYLLTRHNVHTWICGHNHYNFDYHTPGGTHLVSNQRGKPKDHITDYQLSKVIEI